MNTLADSFNPEAGAPIRVLVLDDSEDDVFLLHSQLRAHGLVALCHRVDSASDMAMALAEGDWDLVVSDHHMPGFDSSAALEVLKTSGEDIPFIIYSGAISDQQAFLAMHDGVSDFIPKGNYARLIPVIKRELKGVAARRAMRSADRKLEALAYYDPLTGLPNLSLFCSRIGDWIRESDARGKEPLGVLFYVDLDRFVRINSSFGYDAGSMLLLQIAKRLLLALGDQGWLARIGGDSFGIFMPGISDLSLARIFARKLARAFNQAFLKDQVELFLTASIGVALYPQDAEQVYDLLTNAEAAMLEVKRQGGNSCRFFERSMSTASAERMGLEADLHHAIERDQLWLAYQPCVESASSRIVGAEALLRWKHPSLGALPPDKFIPVAEQSGQIVELGAWVLRAACKECKTWHEQGHEDLMVSVNVSAVQFREPRLIEVVQSALAYSGLPGAALQLEVTETSMMEDAETAIAMLRALKGLGVRIALDDFGTGYSSLAYLKRFPVDVVKIDKSFVRDMCLDEESAAIAKAIVALATSMRRKTLAEGIETAEQAAFLLAERCDVFQGYLFGRPMPAEAFRKLLHEAAPLVRKPALPF